MAEQIHQILITDTGDTPSRVPNSLSLNIDSIHEIYKERPYKLWSGRELESFISQHFDRDVLHAYMKLKPYSYRSDLGRFCLLYELGGMYIDLGVRLLREWNIPAHKGIAAFRDISFVSGSWSAIQTGLLWSHPRRTEFKLAIEAIVRNVHNTYYGCNPLYPTGPVLLGRSIIRAMVDKGQSEEADDQQIGQCRALTFDADVINVCYVSKEGTFVAMRAKDVDGDLSHLGLVGVNNYNKIWRNRSVYGEEVRLWTFDDPLIRYSDAAKKTNNSLVLLPGKAEIAVFGPYVDLGSGFYEVEIRLHGLSKDAQIKIEYTSNCGMKTLKTELLQVGKEGRTISKQEIVLWEESEGFEIRFFNASSGEVHLYSYSLRERECRIWSHRSTDLRFKGYFRGLEAAEIAGYEDEQLIYGPYVSLAAGHYRLLAIFDPATVINTPCLEITANNGEVIIKQMSCKSFDASTKDHLDVEFHLSSDCSNVEFRLRSSGGSAGRFLGYTLHTSQ